MSSKKAKGVAAAVHRQLLDGIKASARPLRTKQGISDIAVHSARKKLKRARASLRLLRPALGDDVYRRENRTLRDAARPLTPVRDAKVLLKTLDALRQRSHGSGLQSAEGEFRRKLVSMRNAAHEQLLKSNAGRRVELLLTSYRRLQGKSGVFDEALLSVGLSRIYKQGRKALAVANSDANDENLHELRKQAKYFGYALEALQAVHPVRMRKLAKHAQRLGECLGDDHDLAVLSAKAAETGNFSDLTAARQLSRLIECRREVLQKKALRTAQHLYAEKPVRIAAQVRHVID